MNASNMSRAFTVNNFRAETSVDVEKVSVVEELVESTALFCAIQNPGLDILAEL